MGGAKDWSQPITCWETGGRGGVSSEGTLAPSKPGQSGNKKKGQS